MDKANDRSNSALMSTMALNDNKAGMEGLDKDKINQIILKASKGSKFYENERKKEEQLNLKIKEQQSVIDNISSTQLQQGLKQADEIIRDLREGRELDQTIVHVDMDAFYAAVEIRDDPSLGRQPMAVGGKNMLTTSNYLARRFGVRAAMPGFIALKLCPQLLIVKPNFEKYTAVSQQVREIFALYDPNFCPMSLDEAYLNFSPHLRERLHWSPSDRTFVLRQCLDSDCNSRLTQCQCDLNQVIRPYLCSLEQWSNHNTSDENMLKFLDQLDLKAVAVQVSKGGGSQVSKDEGPQASKGERSQVSKGEEPHLAVCPQCHKEFPQFCVKVYGLGVEEAVLEMRNRIEQRTQLTASAGIAPNTLLAKVCSDMNKPNGQFRILPQLEQVEQFVSSLPIRKISGIGKVRDKLLGAMGISTCADLYKQRGLLYHLYQPMTFHYFMSVALGLGSTVVVRDGERKSMSTERTFAELSSPELFKDKCRELCHSLASDLQEHQLQGKTVTLKIKTVRFEVKGRSQTLSQETNDEQLIFSAAWQLLTTEMDAARPGLLRLRLMGVRMSKLSPVTRGQTSILSLFSRKSVEFPTSSDGSRQSNPNVPEFSLPQVMGHSTGQEWLWANDLEEWDTPLELTNDQDHRLDSAKGSVVKARAGASKKVSPDKKTVQSSLEGSILQFLYRPGNATNGQDLSLSQKRTNDMICKKDNMTSERDSSLGLRDSLTNEKDVKDMAVSGQSDQDVIWLTHNLDPCQSGPAIDLDTQTDLSCVTVGERPDLALDAGHTQPQVELAHLAQVTKQPANHSPNRQLPEKGWVICPVCSQGKLCWALDKFNAHLDQCLSRQTVQDLLNDGSQGEKSGTSSARGQKRPLALAPANTKANKERKRGKVQTSVALYFKGQLDHPASI